MISLTPTPLHVAIFRHHIALEHELQYYFQNLGEKSLFGGQKFKLRQPKTTRDNQKIFYFVCVILFILRKIHLWQHMVTSHFQLSME